MNVKILTSKEVGKGASGASTILELTIQVAVDDREVYGMEDLRSEIVRQAKLHMAAEQRRQHRSIKSKYRVYRKHYAP